MKSLVRSAVVVPLNGPGLWTRPKTPSTFLWRWRQLTLHTVRDVPWQVGSSMIQTTVPWSLGNLIDDSNSPHQPVSDMPQYIVTVYKRLISAHLSYRHSLRQATRKEAWNQLSWFPPCLASSSIPLFFFSGEIRLRETPIPFANAVFMLSTGPLSSLQFDRNGNFIQLVSRNLIESAR